MPATFPAIPSQGHFLALESRDASGLPGHFLGGNPALASVCRNCDEPFIPLMSLDTGDARLELGEASGNLLPLVFCWRCVSGRSELTYRLGPDQLSVLSQTDSAPRFNFPYADYPASFPRQPFRLHPIPDLVTQARQLQWEGRLAEGGGWIHKFDFEVPLHQVGGLPCLDRAAACPSCPGCDEVMSFLAMVADEPHTGSPFTGIERARVLFFCCRDCRVITALGLLPETPAEDQRPEA